MGNRVYTINELRQLISESASEFKAKIGDEVESSNKKENSISYKETKKRIKEFDGGGSEEKKVDKAPEKIDDNKTMLDYSIDGNVSEDFRDKVKSQAEGYTSSLEKNNGIEKSGDFNKKSYERFKKSGEQMAKNKKTAKKIGLTARELPDNFFDEKGLYKESKKISVLNFKNTTFLNESHMISRIPDEYKYNGNRFKVKDSSDNEFIVEWANDEANILSYENKRKLNEAIEKFHKLNSYNSRDNFKNTTSQSRLKENNNFCKILNKARIITKK